MPESGYKKIQQEIKMSGEILLTGATGYVGGRLLPLLQQSGRRVRCLTRRPDALSDRAGATTTIVRGDVLDPSSLTAAFDGVETAYYLVHSMGEDKDFEEQDRIAAENFAKAAAAAGVQRIIYLGGLGNPDYWYGIYPLHQCVFAGMLRNIAKEAEKPPSVSTPD